MFRGKKYKEIAKQIDKAALYDPKEGLELICKTASAKFDETVELHVKLGVDSRHADQQVRGAIVLPNGTGKTARVLVFAKGDKAEAAKAAGVKSVAMIHVADINKVTGYIRGGCTAIGMKKQYVTRIDESAKTQEQIYVSGGKIGSQIRLTPEDLAKAAKAEFADIIRHEN